MGFLKMEQSVGDFRKGVISFWFQVPSETIDACHAAEVPGWVFTPYWVVIPLLSWGPQKTFVQNAEFGDTGPMAPSFIGVYVGLSDDPKEPALAVNLQTPDIGTSTITEYSYPETFGNADPVYFNNAGYPEILVDEWNHVILSWDLQDVTITDGVPVKSCQIWCAINDEDKNGDDDLPAITRSAFGMGPNDHISTPAGLSTLGVVGKDAASSVTVTGMESNPFCIPGPHPLQYNTDNTSVATRPVILKVELAELQVFSGVTLDTSATTNRRVFVDEDGLPVSPFGTDDDPSLAEDLLGKRPEIILSGTGDWIAGKNSGTLGLNYARDPPEIIESGQFAPTGTIQAFDPDPSLSGTRRRAPPPGVRLTKRRLARAR